MHRLLVALLAAVDAALAVAVGVAATLAPLTLLWVFGFGGDADWGTLWPAAVTLWQLGNLVPLAVTLPPEYLAATGIDSTAASFTLSLAPLAFAAFTAVFAARSGVRASRAGAWATGVVIATVVFAALAAGCALTAGNPVAAVELWRAILVPTLLFGVPALIAALATEWREAADGVVARVRDRVEEAPGGWGDAPSLAARGGAVVVAGLVGLGAAVTAVALFARAGQIVALFQAGNVDGVGATVLTLGQLAYLPTLVVWGLSFAAGPGFALGEGTAVSPAGTQVGVIPGVPLLGAIPESTSSWLLLLALVPVGLGALGGWVARSHLARAAAPGAPDHTVGPRITIAVGMSVLAAAAGALLAMAASGSLGPGRLASFGPAPGPVALAVGLEVLVGAGILLLSPRGRRAASAAHADEEWPTAERPRSENPALVGGSDADAPTWARFSDHDEPDAAARADDSTPAVADAAPSEARTEPIDLPRLD